MTRAAPSPGGPPAIRSESGTTPIVRLDEFCTFSAGGKTRVNKGHYVDEGYPAFSAAGQDGFVEKWEYDRPAVVVTSIGTCGKAYLATGKWTSLANTYIVFPNTEICHPDYLLHVLDDESSWFVSGSVQPFIKPTDIKARKVPLPSFDKQLRIAGILNRAANIERLRNDSARRARDFTPALFLEMFGDPVENPMGWKVGKIGDVGISIDTGFACAKSRLVDDGLLHLRPFNVGRNAELDMTDTYRVPHGIAPRSRDSLRRGDILFNNTNSRELVGKAALVREDLEAGFSNHMTRVRLDTSVCDPEFATCCLLSLWLKGYFRERCTQWIGQAAYGSRLIVQTPILLPSLEKQRRFAAIAKGAARMASRAKAAAGAASALTAALAARLLEQAP